MNKFHHFWAWFEMGGVDFYNEMGSGSDSTNCDDYISRDGDAVDVHFDYESGSIRIIRVVQPVDH